MSSILSCWFWKPKIKSFSQVENKCIQNTYVQTTVPITKGDCKNKYIFESGSVIPTYLKNAESLNINTVKYFERLSGLKSQTKKLKSYPVSPRKTALFQGYFSDQNLRAMSKFNLHSKYSNIVLSTSTPQNVSNYKPRATLGSNEPFPFQVPKDTAPRQSLFYELRYGGTDSLETNENSMDKAEKPMEDYNDPNISRRNPLSQSSTFKHQLYNQDGLESQSDKSSARKTILHVKSSSVQKTPMKSMTSQAGTTVTAHNKSFVRQLQFKPTNRTPLLVTNEGKVLHPLQTDKVRTSFLSSKNKTPSVRVSVVQPVKPLVQEEDTRTPSRRSFRRSSIRHTPVMYRDVEEEQRNRFPLLSKRNMSPPFIEDGEDLDTFPVVSAIRLASVSNENNLESNLLPFAQTENNPVVYAVPVLPTRGKSKSLLQQSVKSLASKNQKEEPVFYRKNIRYSMDTDVFSAETRRRSLSPVSPGFVNMERGQPMLVSEVLNPITSLFISDLKNPVPKDPLKKPKEGNVWVKPRRYSVQRSSLSRQPSKTVTRTSAAITRNVPIQRRLSRKSRYKYHDESSSSDESIVVYRKKSKQAVPRRSYHQAVYAAQTANPVLPKPDYKYRNSLSFTQKSDNQVNMAQTSSSNDICGLKLGSDQKIFERQNLQSPHFVKMVSSAQQTDIEDELDLVCYPSERGLKNSLESSESRSKLRWRIVIKRGGED